jgi:hypothetical protein
MVPWKAQKFVVCGTISLENCLEIKYNQENLRNNEPKMSQWNKKEQQLSHYKEITKRNTGKLAVQNF